ncbi:hypothetical protein [Pseudomonas sp. NPDC099000]|uniref:hypothetical protein n=1 Tax=Pseudomonas sp. NPDC099000 TaxID=3364488 RepID=UPI00383B9872
MKNIGQMWLQLKNYLALHLLVIAVLLAIALILAVSINYFSNFPSVKSTDQAVWGQFGDYFGGVLNPLLSFFALVGLMVTLRSQQSESKKSEERHDEALFDSRLFQLLALSHSAVSSVKFVRASVNQSTVAYEGHRAIAYALNRLQEEFFSNAGRGKGSEMYERLIPEFAKWKKHYWLAIASYIESMLFLVQYVVENAQGKDNMEFAMRAVFAQMSSAEKLLLFYVMIFSENQKSLFLAYFKMNISPARRMMI